MKLDRFKQLSYVNALRLASVLAVLTTLTSCVHEFPECTPRRTTKLTITHLTKWTELDFHHSTRSGADLVRYIINVYSDSESLTPAYTFTRFSTDMSLAPFDTEIDIPSGDWVIRVWSDYMVNGKTFYDASDFSAVTYTQPYTGDTDLRDAFEGKTIIKVGKSSSTDAVTDGKVELERPFARYVFVATDFNRFYEETLLPVLKNDASQGDKSSPVSASKNVLLREYRIKGIYPLFMPSVYNILRTRPVDSQRGVVYDAIIEPLDNDNAKLALDYVFVNSKETTAQVQLQMTTPAGNTTVLCPTISVPLKRGQTTYVYGDFLTNSVGGGIDIDFDFSGDINIEL